MCQDKSFCRTVWIWPVAARKDLTPVFVGRWRFPLAKTAQAGLSKVDWSNADLDVAKVIDTLPIEFQNRGLLRFNAVPAGAGCWMGAVCPCSSRPRTSRPGILSFLVSYARWPEVFHNHLAAERGSDHNNFYPYPTVEVLHAQLMCFHNTYGFFSCSEPPLMNVPDPAGSDQPLPIPPSVPPAGQQELLDRLLGTRVRDRAQVESAHRDLLAASPELHRQLLRWLAAHEPDSQHLSVGLAVLSTEADPAGRRFVADLIATLPMATVAETVDYIHGWYVDRTLTRRARTRFQDEMTRAYEATAGIVRQELEGGQAEEFRGGEILVTLGQYDKVQQVLDHLQLPYQTLPCAIVETLPLRADQVLIINCPGQFSQAALEAIRLFVARGGSLITTDWALETTVQRAFPGTIEYTGNSTADDVVPVSWIHPDHPFTRGVEVPGRTISWWLEGSSYPIRILDQRVTVLIRSQQMGNRYGEDPLVVTFDYGEGTVVHLTSHYYLQRSQGDKSAKAAGPVESQLGQQIVAQAAAGGLSGSQLSAAYSSMRLLANILYECRRKCGV
jgi:hypothetical protein